MNVTKNTMGYTVLMLLFVSSGSFAQTYKTTSWSTSFLLGTSNMLGDLGGSIIKDKRGIYDYNVRAHRLAAETGITMNSGAFSLGLNLLRCRLVGNDAYTTQRFLAPRKLSVRTDLVEVSLLAEVRPFSRSINFNRFYVYSGLGGIYYKPMSNLNGVWYDLRKVGTEGQYLENGPGPYSKLDIVIPYGLGYKFRLAKSTSLLLDLGFRKTFTDYLDDVSTVYADPTQLDLAKPNIPVSQLADKSDIPNAIGYQRGNPNRNDHYLILGLKFEFIIGDKFADDCYYNRNPRKKLRSSYYNFW